MRVSFIDHNSLSICQKRVITDFLTNAEVNTDRVKSVCLELTQSEYWVDSPGNLIPSLLWETWMRQVDQVLEVQELLHIGLRWTGVLACPWPNSRTRGRPRTPAEVVVRLPLLKHMRNWSYTFSMGEVRANFIYRHSPASARSALPMHTATLGGLRPVSAH
jgi:hypothetical protein